ncbi:MAG: penicillin acylase [Actinomycetes bacterium]|nr:MAG: penicillin acylase [Actinomycetes bacterium]
MAAATLPSAATASGKGGQKDLARYILPPGNYGGVPFTENSTDQLPLYSGLTPLRDDVTKADINDLFLPQDFAPIGDAHEEETGEPGLKLIYDAYGIPHVYGKTRYDVAFGAGWTTARDRQLLLALGRGPARAAVADVPNLNAFSLVTSGQSFVPSAEAEALVTAQRKLLVREYGKKGREIIRDAQAYADGINAYNESKGIAQPPATVNDVIAVTAFIGSIFGAGGGAEAANADLLANLEQELGQGQGYRAWEDVMLAEDPEAPTTIDRRFDYPPLTGGKVKGSVVVDPGSIESVDPRVPAGDAGLAPARRQASNWLLSSRQRSATGNTLGVMGPQLGYYYPEIVQQIHLEGPGIKAQGAAVPGLAMYLLIGRTKDYAWSLTSAGHDVRDAFAEKLCEPDGATPTRESDHYVYKGKCRPLESFTAGELNGTPLTYDRSVHGSVYATATIDGKPYALALQRSTFGRDGLNLAALHDMTGGRAKTPQRFYKTANQFGFTFNWAYTSRDKTAYFSSGRLPERARGLDRRLPTLGTGKYEWRGFLSRNEHPHAVGGPDGLLLNWNNQSAPGFMHGDDEPYGSEQRVELFDQWPRRPRITDNVGIMNRAATEDVRAPTWEVVSRMLAGSAAPNARAQQVVDLLDDWVGRDAPRLDVNGDGTYDEAGPTIMNDVWVPIAEAVMEPRFGDLLDELNDVRGLGGASGQSYVDKDLRTQLGERVKGRFHLRYCGAGDIDACRASLWAAIDASAAELAADFGSDDPASWRGPASTTGFVPGILPNRFPTTNRPTYQQVLELRHRR